ncbi:trypsin beta-like [Drosophila gunungcola]|uniref:trypsin beta-like n=1 Tax=Drosophila gunungcola TaxID=103775 RepID=UPI0022E0D490|nr:trypsin beta-like [Drosophila gunungcola]
MIVQGLVFIMLVVTVSSKRFQGPEKRIVDGNPVGTHIPWQVALSQNGSLICGGVIYSERVVLTAAHCVYGVKIKDVSVRAGSLSWNSGGQLVKIKSSVSHEKFNLTILTNDIAVLFLSSSLKFDNFTRNVKLAKRTPEVGTPATVSGWGWTYFNPDGKTPDKLHAVTVFVKERKRCDKAYSKLAELLAEDTDVFLEKDQICASAFGAGSCPGDSGGPLVTTSSKRLIGIVSGGFRCLTPSIYSDVAVHKKWIESTVSCFCH